VTLKALPFSDISDFDDASRGFLGTLEHARITSAQGRVVWSLEPYGFLSDAEAPPTVDPSLWRQSRLNMHHGIFEVVPGVYQIRGLDIANMTLIEGERGVIVVDTLTLDRKARAPQWNSISSIGDAGQCGCHLHPHPYRPLGGARGVLDDETLASGKVPIIAPKSLHGACGFGKHQLPVRRCCGARISVSDPSCKGCARSGRLRSWQVDGGGSVALLRRPIRHGDR